MSNSVARFFRTPKGLMILTLGVLLPLAAVGSGIRLVAPGVLAASGAAAAVDAPILRWRDGSWAFPDGALLTGLFVAMILSPHEPWYIAAVTAAVGVLSKYAIRVRSANVFNPAALALVATFYVFNTGQSWWGALPELPLVAVTVLFATGIFITDRVHKGPAVLSFLGSYYAAITIAAFVADPGKVAELYRAPDLHAALFFAFFMVTDPPTSPPKQRDQIAFGIIAGLVSYAVFQFVGAAYFLLAGLLVANAWEAWRRTRVAADRTRARQSASHSQPPGAP
jgi:Na+-translocating ferredoxin:NAD+ oxidoreductase RnfD subunit